MLTFVRESEDRSKDKHKLWVCKCDCGHEGLYISSRIRANLVKQCKLCATKITAKKNRTHGMGKTSEYKIWTGIKTRCLNVNDHSYAKYGAKGITVCKEWENSFEEFFKYVGRRPSKNHSIDRIDNSKGYEPGNVRWATKSEQARNRNNNSYVTDGVRILHINDAADELGITRGAAHLRLKRGKLNGFTKN